MSNCKYCRKEENKQLFPCLTCKQCEELVHLECLHKKTPGGFAGDIFFTFTCAECSDTREEIFERGKMSWFHCLVIVLFDLRTKCIAISNQGYFHWRTHIGTFINKNWSFLFNPQFKMKKNWAGTFSGVLSQYSPIFFKSGSEELNQSGWWKLSHALSPSLIKNISSEIIIAKQNERTLKSEFPQSNKQSDYAIFVQLVNAAGFSNLLSSGNEDAVNPNISNGTSLLKSKSDTLSSHSESMEDVDDNKYLYKYEFPYI